MEVVLVVGLPASGKSTWASEQVRQAATRGQRHGVLDDPASPQELEDGIRQARDSGVSCLYIVDPRLCEESTLRLALHHLEQAYGVTAKTVFFANDPGQCALNAKNRGLADKPVLASIRRWSEKYAPPEDVLAVYRSHS